MVNTWSFYSNPAKADTDGDGLSDQDDINLSSFDTRLIQVTDNFLKFNTGRQWDMVDCTAYDYLDNLFRFVDGKVDNPIAISVMQVLSAAVIGNRGQTFNRMELDAICVYNPEGSKLYLNDKTNTLREQIFKDITGRPCKYYLHNGILSDEVWTDADSYKDGGFFKGKVFSEADFNFTTKEYTQKDIYDVVSGTIQIGALILTVALAAEVIPVVAVNLQTLAYYYSVFGIKEGYKMYKYLGTSGLPDNMISWLQTGTQRVDDEVLNVAQKLSKESVVDKLNKYLLNPEHPVGSSKAKWFDQALGFTRSNMDVLANQIVFNSNKAVQTGVTEFGTKYNQVISITGANGKTIDVTFAWIKNNDDIVRLITAIPTKQ
jgi:hypothetical protein